MANEKTPHTGISRYVSNLLETQFGEPPAEINVTIKKSFIVIHLLDFLLPSEKILIKNNETKRLLETRTLIINGVKDEIMEELQSITGFTVQTFHADWNLEKKTGMFLAILDGNTDKSTYKWPVDVDKNALKKKIINTSKASEKAPDVTEIYWLNERTILIERKGIMIEIERELIKNGVIEELRLAKRPLEHKLLDDINLEPILKQPISELFVDWDFENDKAYVILILEEEKKQDLPRH